jgi:hypothetical protein
LDPEIAENQLIPRTGVMEDSMFKLAHKRILGVQEQIQERIISSQADLEAETEKSATALQLVEKNRGSVPSCWELVGGSFTHWKVSPSLKSPRNRASSLQGAF